MIINYLLEENIQPMKTPFEPFMMTSEPFRNPTNDMERYQMQRTFLAWLGLHEPCPEMYRYLMHSLERSSQKQSWKLYFWLDIITSR